MSTKNRYRYIEITITGGIVKMYLVSFRVVLDHFIFYGHTMYRFRQDVSVDFDDIIAIRGAEHYTWELQTIYDPFKIF